MKLNKKVIEGMTVAVGLLVMTSIAAFGGSTEDNISDAAEYVALDKNGTAGIIFELHNMESEIIGKNEFVFASIEKAQKDIVSTGSQNQVIELEDLSEAVEVEVLAEQNVEIAAERTTEETIEESTETAQAEIVEETSAVEVLAELETVEPELSPEELEWQNRVMADVEEDMNIRTAPDAESEIAGKFYRGDVADVVAVEGEWTQITSGNVTGYVKNEYLVYGMDANALANEVCTLYATVNTDGLRLRREPSEEADILTTAANGDKLKVDKEAEEVEGWVAVSTSDSTGYVSADYVEVALNLGTALNAEEAAAKEAKKAGRTKHSAVAASVDDVTLLGALIQCEAGSSSYEGMLAVGSVVMNRVRSGRYAGSISGVIYQNGQFPPALNGTVAGVISRGVNGSCLRAAQEAINGVDNTNGALSFRSAASGCAGTVIGGNVFF